jgi:hypothetical protein
MNDYPREQNDAVLVGKREQGALNPRFFRPFVSRNPHTGNNSMPGQKFRTDSMFLTRERTTEDLKMRTTSKK